MVHPGSAPWLFQWHGDLGPEYESFLETEGADLGVTLEQARRRLAVRFPSRSVSSPIHHFESSSRSR